MRKSSNRYSCSRIVYARDIEPESHLVQGRFSRDITQRSLYPTLSRYDYLLRRLTRGGHNALYMGETGVGKSVVMQKYLDDATDTNDFVAYTMKYSAQTKPTNLKVSRKRCPGGRLTD